MYLTLHVVVSNSIILLASVAMPGELKLGVKGLLAFGAGKVTVRFSNVSSTCLPEKKQSRIGCIYATFLHCAFSNVSSNRLHEKRHSGIGCICMTFPHCGHVGFQMCPQMACLRSCIVTLVAFVWLFSTVCFQMNPQIACLGRGIVALVAFMQLFSTVHFHMIRQNACIRGSKVTLVAFV